MWKLEEMRRNNVYVQIECATLTASKLLYATLDDMFSRNSSCPLACAIINDRSLHHAIFFEFLNLKLDDDVLRPPRIAHEPLRCRRPAWSALAILSFLLIHKPAESFLGISRVI
jgi:hypothetical protein